MSRYHRASAALSTPARRFRGTSAPGLLDVRVSPRPDEDLGIVPPRIATPPPEPEYECPGCGWIGSESDLRETRLANGYDPDELGLGADMNQDCPECDLYLDHTNYEIGHEYDIDPAPDSGLAKDISRLCDRLRAELLPRLGAFGTFSEHFVRLPGEAIAIYISGTRKSPVVGIDLKRTQAACDEHGDNCYGAVKVSVLHELAHAVQEWHGMPPDERQAEDFAIRYDETGKVDEFWTPSGRTATSGMGRAIESRGTRGDDLLDALDLADELAAAGAEVNDVFPGEAHVTMMSRGGPVRVDAEVVAARTEGADFRHAPPEDPSAPPDPPPVPSAPALAAAAAREYGGRASGGNCGQFALGLARFLKDAGAHPDPRIGLIHDGESETEEELRDGEPDIYHVFLQLGGAWYDATGRIGRRYLADFAAAEYGDARPDFMTDLPPDENTRRIISYNTAWDIEWTDFYRFFEKASEKPRKARSVRAAAGGIVVYHGSDTAGLDRLRAAAPPPGGIGPGVYVGLGRETASFYGANVYTLRTRFGWDEVLALTPETWRPVEGAEGHSVLVGEHVPPFTFDAGGKTWTVGDEWVADAAADPGALGELIDLDGVGPVARAAGYRAVLLEGARHWSSVNEEMLVFDEADLEMVGEAREAARRASAPDHGPTFRDWQAKARRAIQDAFSGVEEDDESDWLAIAKSALAATLPHAMYRGFSVPAADAAEAERMGAEAMRASRRAVPHSFSKAVARSFAVGVEPFWAAAGAVSDAGMKHRDKAGQWGVIVSAVVRPDMVDWSCIDDGGGMFGEPVYDHLPFDKPVGEAIADELVRSGGTHNAEWDLRVKPYPPGSADMEVFRIAPGDTGETEAMWRKWESEWETREAARVPRPQASRYHHASRMVADTGGFSK